MPVTLFSFVALFRQRLATAVHLLDEGAEQVGAGRPGGDAALSAGGGEQLCRSMAGARRGRADPARGG